MSATNGSSVQSDKIHKHREQNTLNMYNETCFEENTMRHNSIRSEHTKTNLDLDPVTRHKD